jgi:NAD(P)-dependent dehydrogenase (short-subunit alcohol dehydrogenase family)
MGLLAGRVAMVTGAGRGLGRATALRFAAEGADLALVDRDAAALAEAAGRAAAAGGRVAALPADLGEPAAAGAAVDEAVRRLGRLDVLVNAAGLLDVEPVLEVTPAAWDRAFAVNARGLFFCLQAAARVMVRQGGGRIVNVTSPASRVATPATPVYAATKAAVDSLTRSAAAALAPHGVTVNAVAPGRMETEMTERLDAALAARAGRDYAALRAERAGQVPLGRRGAPEEVAEAVLWLVGPGAAYVTGCRLNVSGGLEID